MADKIFSTRERKLIVRAGKELCVFTEEDVAFVMDMNNDENACRRRLTTARKREEPIPKPPRTLW